ncbi:YitT family protein [Oleidesulfovibrio sp.]|uniref:YitT family protein n=1 Tax=Oleidesulfovibrio sp. TaxID=2909707 RepID=UPI003A8816CA
MRNRDFYYSVVWNLLLITAGSCIFAISLKGLATPQQFVPGGVFGFASLLYYQTGWLDPGTLNLILNIPIFIFGYLKISKRFVLYSLYATVLTSLLYTFVDITIPIHNQLYAAVAAGALSGFGAGIILRSVGSGGGMDIIAIYLLQKYNIGVGKTSFGYNLVLYMFTATYMLPDIVVASIIMVFITAATIEYTLSLFNQRKVVFIISQDTEGIAKRIMSEMHRGATILKGYGAYTGAEKNVLMSVINNIQLKKLEEIVFTTDPGALFIVENTFSVLGTGFGQRKRY